MEERTKQELLRELNRLTRAQARIKRRTTILLCIIAFLILVSGTLAWFTLSNFASVQDIQLKISTAPELYLDIENRGTEDLTQWKKTLTTDMVNAQLLTANAPILDDQVLDPVTSTDGIRFFSESGVARTANKDSYVEFKVWFLATREMYVHLSGATVEVDGHTATTSVTTPETGDKANIVRAVRVSFEDAGTAVIYEPNKNGADVPGQTTFDVIDGFASDTAIFHLDSMTPKEITVRLWLEGEDDQCTNAVQAADVTFNFLFGGADENGNSFE